MSKHKCDWQCSEYGCEQLKEWCNEKTASSLSAGVNDKEPLPKKNDTKPIWDLIIEEMKERDQVGRRKYKTPLQSMNGRNSPIDALQEFYDLIAYTRQWVEERKEIVEILKYYAEVDELHHNLRPDNPARQLLNKLGEL